MITPRKRQIFAAFRFGSTTRPEKGIGGSNYRSPKQSIPLSRQATYCTPGPPQRPQGQRSTRVESLLPTVDEEPNPSHKLADQRVRRMRTRGGRGEDHYWCVRRDPPGVLGAAGGLAPRSAMSSRLLRVIEGSSAESGPWHRLARTHRAQPGKVSPEAAAAPCEAQLPDSETEMTPCPMQGPGIHSSPCQTLHDGTRRHQCLTRRFLHVDRPAQRAKGPGSSEHCFHLCAATESALGATRRARAGTHDCLLRSTGPICGARDPAGPHRPSETVSALKEDATPGCIKLSGPMSQRAPWAVPAADPKMTLCDQYRV